MMAYIRIVTFFSVLRKIILELSEDGKFMSSSVNPSGKGAAGCQVLRRPVRLLNLCFKKSLSPCSNVNASFQCDGGEKSTGFEATMREMFVGVWRIPRKTIRLKCKHRWELLSLK